MVRTIPAVIIGAGGATAAYEYGENIMEHARDAMRSIMHHATRPRSPKESRGGGDNGSSLAGEIENLKRMMRESSNRNVVVVNRGSSASWSLLSYTALAAGLGYLYLRYVKGWRLGDFFYVSQATLKASTEALKQGIDGLKEYTSKTKEYLQSRLDKMETKQDDQIERTERIDDRITDLHGDVDQMKDNVEEVGQNVKEVKGTLGDIQDAQQYNSQGIFLLLRVVGELVCNNDFQIGARKDLEHFSQRPPPLPAGQAIPGLESLIDTRGTSEESFTSRQNLPTLPIAPPPASPREIQEIVPPLASSSSATVGRQTPRIFTRSPSLGTSAARLVNSAEAGFGSRRKR